jgi:hypothetical protein
VAVARQLIGPNVKAATSQLTFKMPGMQQGVDWHFDNGCASLPPASPLIARRRPRGAPAPRLTLSRGCHVADGHLFPHTSLSCLLALDDVDLDNVSPLHNPPLRVVSTPFTAACVRLQGPVRLVPGSHLAGQRALDDGAEYNSAASNSAFLPDALYPSFTG